MSDFGKVAVLMGGRSAERAVSLKSGSMVLGALKKKGMDAHAFDPKERGLSELIQERFNRAFIALHGRYGEDGTIRERSSWSAFRIPALAFSAAPLRWTSGAPSSCGRQAAFRHRTVSCSRAKAILMASRRGSGCL